MQQEIPCALYTILICLNPRDPKIWRNQEDFTWSQDQRHWKMTRHGTPETRLAKYHWELYERINTSNRGWEVRKRFTNHSGRKTVVKKLKASNVPESSIVKVTGHSSVAGLQSYDPEDEQEFQQMSNAIGLQAAGSSGIGNLPTIIITKNDLILNSTPENRL